jgi:hypothetical protein
MLWWLTYRHGAATAGIAFIAAPSLIHARMRAVLDGIDEGIEFNEGHAIDAHSARLIMPSERGRLLRAATRIAYYFFPRMSPRGAAAPNPLKSFIFRPECVMEA